MLVSQFFISTTKETPADAELASHQLLIRAGLIKKLASGLYTWMPLGLRVLKKVEKIIREEMDASGALECLLPVVQPGELWEESGRFDKYGLELLRFKDRHDRDFCMGPTHEEVMTDIARREVRSYKQLPLNLYQIQIKFRDEIRPRFGLMRAREFLMKDAYSFDIDEEAMNRTYQKMYEAYNKIFTKLGLKFRPVLADSGAIGGNYSHEFQVLADAGEDVVVYSDGSDYAANIERAEAKAPDVMASDAKNKMEKVATPNLRTIADLVEKMNWSAKQGVKTLIVKGVKDPLIAIILRGDHELNALKVEKFDEVAQPLQFADEADIKNAVGCSVGSIGPVNLKIPFIVDRDAAVLINFNCGANEDDFHFINVNWGRDVQCENIKDCRNVVEGDESPDGKGKLRFARGIEVGHVFQFGTKYSKAMNATVLTENGKSIPIQMGSYGIGVSRVVAAAIEQNHDKNGIKWPQPMAPFAVVMIPIQMHKSYRVRDAANKIYEELKNAGIEVLFDDRKERPGVMFADWDLIGIPHRLVIGERGLDNNQVEYKARDKDETETWQLDAIVKNLHAKQND